MSCFISRVTPTFRLSRSIALLMSGAALTLVHPVVAVAQQQPGGPAVPSAALDAEAAARAAAQRQLTESLGRIAEDGSDAVALSQAGRAALALGDARAAVGFLARAEALLPRDPVVKAALGAAMVQLEDPQQAMRYFDAAVAAGGLDRTYMGDRGLAFDLLGDQARAQADYVVAAQSAPSAELTRRHAISLGISGQTDQAIQMLAPLLRAQDRAAWRSRAMIVAMNGRVDEAREIARTTMPAQLAEAVDPYWPLMDRLTPPQLAAAAHFGRFPSYETVRAQPSRQQARLAAAAPAPAPASTRNQSRSSRSSRSSRNRAAQVAAATPTPAPAAVASAAPPVSSAPRPGATSATSTPTPAPRPTPAPQPAPTPQPTPTPQPARSVAATTPAPAPSPAPSPAPAPTPAPAPRPVQVASLPPSTQAVAGPPDGGIAARVVTPTPAPTPSPAAVTSTPVVQPSPSPATPAADTRVIAGWSMADMVQSIEVPETERAASAQALSLADVQAIAAERRREQQAQAAEARAREQAETRQRQQEEAAARRRAEADAAARAEAERRRANPARIWVQVATGANASALAFDCRRLTRQYAEQFRGQSCSTAEWGRTRRLVVGPFRNQSAAREWEGAYKRAGGDAFIWSSAVGEEVTPVGGR